MGLWHQLSLHERSSAQGKSSHLSEWRRQPYVSCLESSKYSATSINHLHMSGAGVMCSCVCAHGLCPPSERCNGLWRGSRCVPGTMERQSVIDSLRSAAVSRDEQTKLLRKRTMQMQDKQRFSRSDWDIAEVFATVDKHKSTDVQHLKILLVCSVWNHLSFCFVLSVCRDDGTV